MRWWIGIALILAGCGSSPTSPSPVPQPIPQPQPSSITVTVSLIDTMTGAAIGSSVQSVNTLPALLPLSVAGYLPRTARISSASPTIDLIPESFDLAFYRQLARNGYEAPGSLEQLRVLSQAPSIYLQTAGLSAATVAAMEQAARATIPALTGGRFSVATWETGEAIRPDRSGWITVELIADDSANCGRSFIGAPAGHVWLNTVERCRRNSSITTGVFAHELGHAVGFWHVESAGLMRTPTPPDATPSGAERAAAFIAYHRSAGNRDVDVDAMTVSSSSRVVVD